MLLSGVGAGTRSRDPEPVAGTGAGAGSKLDRLHNTGYSYWLFEMILILTSFTRVG